MRSSNIEMNNMRTKLRAKIREKKPYLITAGAFLTVLFLFLWPRILISVHPGELGVLYSRFFGGTILDRIYQEGLHVIAPWDILYVYDVRILEETQNVDVLTLDGLTVKVQASLRYQLIRDKLPSLHQQIGPEFKKKVILPVMTSAVRQTIGSYRPDALYSTARQELQDKMLVDATEELGRLPILVHGFVVKSILLPEALSQAIADKLVAEQRYLRYRYLILEAREEAKRKAVEGQGIRNYQYLVNQHMTDNFLRYEGIQATNRLASSNNAKVVVIGSGKDGLPLILNTSDTASANPENAADARPGSDLTPLATGNATESGEKREGNEPSWQMNQAEFFNFLEKLDRTLLSPGNASVLGR